MVMRPLLFLLTIPLAVGILFPLGALVGEACSGTTSAGDVLGMLLSPPMLRAVGNTLWVGGLTALLSTVLGGILAYTMTLTKAPGRKALGLLFMVPLLAPSLRLCSSLSLSGRSTNACLTPRFFWEAGPPDVFELFSCRICATPSSTPF